MHNAPDPGHEIMSRVFICIHSTNNPIAPNPNQLGNTIELPNQVLNRPALPCPDLTCQLFPTSIIRPHLNALTSGSEIKPTRPQLTQQQTVTCHLSPVTCHLIQLHRTTSMLVSETIFLVRNRVDSICNSRCIRLGPGFKCQRTANRCH